MFFTCKDNGGAIETFKFSDGSNISSTAAVSATGRPRTYDTLMGTDMVFIGYEDNYILLVNMISLAIVWERDYAPSGEGNAIRQVTSFQLRRLFAFSSKDDKHYIVD